MIFYNKTSTLLLILLSFLFVESTWAKNSVNNIRLWDSPSGTRIVLDLKEKPNFNVFRLDKPNRIVVDLKNMNFRGKIPYIKRSHALVKNLRSAERKKNIRRFVIDTKSRLKYKIYALAPNRKYGHRLVIELSASAKAALKKSQVRHGRGTTLRDVIIAVDAGHGGEDPGAIGYYGTQEKRITLTIAKKLKRLIDKQKGMRAVLIRTGDYYVSLRNRIELARKSKADMFISIHADAFKNPKVKGSSVYVLSERGASDEASKWLADQENSSDLIGGVSLDDKDKTLAMVLLDLSQTATIDASTRVADNVLSEIRRVGPVHKRRVQSARFVVLKSPDIPSLLVETAFISNPSEEKRLRDGRYQNKLARAILRGIKKYFKTNPLPNTYLASKGHSQRQFIDNKMALLASPIH